MTPIWYIFPPEWVKSNNEWHHSCMTPRLPILLHSRELPPVPIHEWRHPFGTSFPLSGWNQKMGHIIQSWHPDYLFYCIVGNCHHFELLTRNFKSFIRKVPQTTFFFSYLDCNLMICHFAEMTFEEMMISVNSPSSHFAEMNFEKIWHKYTKCLLVSSNYQ